MTFSYEAGHEPRAALSDVSLEVGSGEVVAVLGANGSGKSTLARLANGILVPQSGDVSVDGISTLDHRRLREVRERVGVVYQHPDDQIVATAVEDDVAFGPENLGLPREEIRARVDAALATVDLTGLERREPHLLSGGQKQRLAIAGALAMSPRYLVLDEPTSMLDPIGCREVRALIQRLREAGHGVLLVTHDLGEASIADRAIVLSGGSVAFEGDVAALLSEPGLAGWGLELPAIASLAAHLRALGVPLDSRVLDPDALARQLWA